MNEYLKYTNVQNDVSGIKRLKFIIDFCDKNFTKAKILDAGCGTGSISIPLGLKHEVTGIDIDKASISIAEKRNKFENARFSAGEISGIKEQHDVVLCIQVLEHLEKPEEMMNAIFRTSKKFAIITVPNGYGISEITGRIIGRARGTAKLKNATKTNEGMFTANYDNPHIQKFTIKKIRKLAENAGFTIKQIKNHNFLMSAFPFNQLFFHTPLKRALEKIDEAIADMLPHFMASGWYFVLEKK
jgi:2-polyprenyl-3-methyl-5-hydroxy-6-metoxy-1,4-benzoquinol methylase